MQRVFLDYTNICLVHIQFLFLRHRVGCWAKNLSFMCTLYVELKITHDYIIYNKGALYKFIQMNKLHVSIK